MKDFIKHKILELLEDKQLQWIKEGQDLIKAKNTARYNGYDIDELLSMLNSFVSSKEQLLQILETLKKTKEIVYQTTYKSYYRITESGTFSFGEEKYFKIVNKENYDIKLLNYTKGIFWGTILIIGLTITILFLTVVLLQKT